MDTCPALQRLRQRRANLGAGPSLPDSSGGGGELRARRVLDRARGPANARQVLDRARQPANAGPDEPTLTQLLDRADKEIDAAAPLVDFADRWEPLRRDVDKLRAMPDTAANRREARSVMASIADVAGKPGLFDDLKYYAEHPKEGIKTTLGFTDPTGKDNEGLPSWAKWVLGAIAASVVADVVLK